MDHEDRISAIEVEVAALAAAFEDAPARIIVPTCPEWTTMDLAQHVGEFTGFWTHVLCEGTGRAKTPYHEPGLDERLGRWYQELGGHLVQEFRAAPPDTAVWTWVDDERTARFIARRCSNELAFHRFDAQVAAGQPQPIPAGVALDAIDEVFVMLRAWGPPPAGHVGAGEVLRLEATDTPDVRSILLSEQGPRLADDADRPALIVVGAASDLSLTMFGRPALRPVEHVGDSRVLRLWYEEFTF